MSLKSFEEQKQQLNLKTVLPHINLPVEQKAKLFKSKS